MRLLSVAAGHLQRCFSRGTRPLHSRPQLAPLLSAPELLQLRQRAHGYRPALAMQHDVAHSMRGDQRSVFRGQGLDYEESRPYQPGDDVRCMDWRTTARLNTPYIKVFREERRPGLFLLIDRRCSMRFGTRRRLKASQAVRAAALLAFAARHRNEPVSGLILEHPPRWIWAGHDPLAAENLINSAAGICPPCRTQEREPLLPETLKLLQTMLIRGSRVYLLSDFFDLDDQARTVLLQLASEHQLAACHIIDPAELSLPAAGQLEISNPGQPTFEIDSASPPLRQAYAAQADTFVEQRKQRFTRLGLDYIRLMTTDDAIENQLL
jgi:uncharacterized protein (DUF58 family)